MEKETQLSQLLPGQSARIKSLQMDGSMKRRLLDLGLTENTKIICLGKSPMGDPSAYLVRGSVIAIRAQDSRHIHIKTM